MQIEEIYIFLVKETGAREPKLSPYSDLVSDIGVDGDDFSELIEKFAETYYVDLKGYRWYFHHAEEGLNIGSLFFKPPYKQVENIPVTPQILLEAANANLWPIKYPEHRVEERRTDITINNIIVVGVAVLVFLIWLSTKFVA